MSEDYQVSLPEIDTLVEIAVSQKDVFGARLTGGGFGGSIVVLARAGQAARVADKIARRYREETGQKPEVLVPRM
jgi:galactokinase